MRMCMSLEFWANSHGFCRVMKYPCIQWYMLLQGDVLDERILKQFPVFPWFLILEKWKLSRCRLLFLFLVAIICSMMSPSPSSASIVFLTVYTPLRPPAKVSQNPASSVTKFWNPIKSNNFLLILRYSDQIIIWFISLDSKTLFGLLRHCSCL